MPVMIPAECDLTRRPMSERVVFDAIRKNLSDGWCVFHSFDYVTRDLARKRWDGEIDFLLYHPEKGLLVLEVKGGNISHRDGQWFQEMRVIDPVGQARRGKYAVKRLLEHALGRELPLKFAHAVCFPSCGAEKLWPPEAQGIVLTGDRLSYIEEFAEKILEEAQIPAGLTGSVPREEVLRVLSPVFEYGQRLSDRIGLEEKQFFLLTEQQCRLLDALENFPRLPVCGCAGSGKTVMAVKKALRLAEQGKSVLLLCFNQLLARRLRKATASSPNVRAAAFFELCVELLKIPEAEVSKYRNDPRLYSDVLPKLLKNWLYGSCFCYDALVVDEGQDFTPQAWEVIRLLVAEDGPFYIFYDPDQNIFTRELNIPDLGVPPVKLAVNCRNTKKIFEALAPCQTLAAAVPEDAPEGAEVRELRGDSRGLLAQELERLIETEKLPVEDVVVLGGHALEHTSLGDDPCAGRFRLVERLVPAGGTDVAYFTYMKFKGCEAKAVILLDVDSSDERWSDRGLYTAMSRAVHELVIIRR